MLNNRDSKRRRCTCHPNQGIPDPNLSSQHVRPFSMFARAPQRLEPAWLANSRAELRLFHINNNVLFPQSHTTRRVQSGRRDLPCDPILVRYPPRLRQRAQRQVQAQLLHAPSRA